MGRIRGAQGALWAHQRAWAAPVGGGGSEPHGASWGGVESLTTLGSFRRSAPPRTPLFGVRCLRWFRSWAAAGDRIAVFSSSSFPGLLYAVLAAAESAGLELHPGGLPGLLHLGGQPAGAALALHGPVPAPGGAPAHLRDGLHTLGIRRPAEGSRRRGGGSWERAAREDGTPCGTQLGPPEARLEGMIRRVTWWGRCVPGWW